ncbi:phage tail protein [Kluyvera ascorbata]|uniref:phage tail protein n=1 Tax=Kluyvera ascorbata TaxID=51288 RepID=UPI0039F6F617
MAQSFDGVKYPLLSQLHPTNVLPADMRGYGVRGWDNGRGVDTGRTLMSAQSSGAPNLTGTVQNVVGILGAGNTGAALGWTAGGVSSTAKSGTDSGVISIVLDASKSSTEYQAITEVRSKTVAWNMIVRAK